MKSREEQPEVSLTHPEKVLFPAVDVTKEDLAEYYHSVASYILPYVKHRPLVLVRCPAGVDASCFFQKHPGQSIPKLPTQKIKEKGKAAEYALVETESDLIRLVQANVLEIHIWNCSASSLETPDQFIIDLDPADNLPYSDCISAAKLVRDFLSDLGLKSFPRLTGGKGVHVVVPIAAKNSWDEVKDFTHQIALTLQTNSPEKFIAQSSKVGRKGKIFVDYLRNSRGATAVANYSTRARPGATVAVPIEWEELTKSNPPDKFTVKTISKRLKSLKTDPWEGFFQLKQKLPAFKK